jgi:hypothetical protein
MTIAKDKFRRKGRRRMSRHARASESKRKSWLTIQLWLFTIRN